MRWLLLLIFLSTSNVFAEPLFERLRPLFEELAADNDSSLGSISYYTSDYNYDDIEDVLVLYTLENHSGNSYSQHAALMLGKIDRGYEVHLAEVGDKTTRTANYKYFKDGIFYFDTQNIKEDDPFCCPSGVGVMFMSFVPNELTLHETESSATMKLLRYVRRKIDLEKNNLLNDPPLFSQGLCQVGKFIPYNALFSQIQFEKVLRASYTFDPKPTHLRVYFASASYPEKIKIVNDMVDAIKQTTNLLGGRGCDARLIDVLINLD
ncbi:hypothetical protein [Vibrio sp. F13]|uniref:hypothetical protein n=1 Tax=Vibrio sp. F13 TaxID=2070777 RepID=UPI0010BD59AC|nr:hypothetical protein [Vibrio sp. F13]TKF96443.1 hypothetical protein FCV76_22735 [Vibrio sp. F13]